MPKSATINPIVVLKKSFLFYILNIFRFAEILAWVILPASVLFVLFFFWGLTENALLFILQIFYTIICPLLSLLLLIVVVKEIKNIDENRKVSTLTLYTQAFSVYGSFLWVIFWYLLKILLWASPFLISFFIFKELKLWSLIFIIPGALAAYLYGFSFFALLIDDKKGLKALALSAELIKRHWKVYLLFCLLLMLIMFPLTRIIMAWTSWVYDLSLLGSFFSIMFQVSLVNLATGIILTLGMVGQFLMYKEFKNA